jgi:hypothetical protein
MSDFLTPVRAALDAANAPLDIFLRDDDAGWNDARLIALLDVAARAGVAIDLAVIPLAIGDALARELRARIDAAPGRVGVQQHGYAHLNHQIEGRSGEFGLARDLNAQRQDLLLGRDLLQQHFDDRLDAIFTPPWNRCAPGTPLLLAELGYTTLSRDRGATPQSALPELPVDVDWSKHYRAGGPAAVADALAHAINHRSADRQPLGLMLHHAVIDEGEQALFEDLLVALASHPRLRWRSMRSLLGRAPGALHTSQRHEPPNELALGEAFNF